MSPMVKFKHMNIPTIKNIRLISSKKEMPVMPDSVAIFAIC